MGNYTTWFVLVSNQPVVLNKSGKVKQTWLQIFWFCWTNAETHAKQKLRNSLTKKRDYNWSSGWALPGDLGALSFCEILIPEIIWIFHPLDHCKIMVFQVTYCCVLWQSALLYCVRHSCNYCDNKCAKHQQSQCEVDFCLLTVWHTSRYRLVVTRWPSTNSNTLDIQSFFKIQFFLPTFYSVTHVTVQISCHALAFDSHACLR